MVMRQHPPRQRGDFESYYKSLCLGGGVRCSSSRARVSSRVNCARIFVRPVNSVMTVRQVDHAGSKGSTPMLRSAARSILRRSCIARQTAFKSCNDGHSGRSRGKSSSMVYTAYICFNTGWEASGERVVVERVREDVRRVSVAERVVRRVVQRRRVED